MKIKNVLAAVLVSGLFIGCASEAKKEAKLQAEAKVTRAEAERTALAQVPGGTIQEGELEKEKGKLIWSFDIAAPGTKDITEVNVDALSGAVVSTEKETPAHERAEKKQEKDDDEKK